MMNYRRLNSENLQAYLSELKQNRDKDVLLKILAKEKNLVFGCWNNNKLIATGGIEYLDFDSHHFGCKIGRLIDTIYVEKTSLVQKKDIIKILLTEAFQEGFSHISAKYFSENLSDVQVLESSDFSIVVCNIILSRNVLNEDIINPPSLIRNATTADLKSLQSITSLCFSDGTRFHLDHHFSREKSTELHVRWVENLLISKEAKVWCAEIDSTVVGFITCQILDHSDISEEKVGYIDLIAVDKNYQGRGIGSSLISAVLFYLKGKVEKVMIDTESINYPALRLYQKNNFSIVGSRYVLHKWLQ